MAPRAVESNEGESLTHLWDEVVRHVGGGCWPPQPENEENWPTIIKEYATICDLAANRFTIDPNSCLFLEQPMRPTNQITDFREWMKKDLQTRIPCIDEAMAAITNGMTIPKHQALFSCLIHLLHMYRWGQAPIIEEALSQDPIDFPLELLRPLKYLGESFGLQHNAGCAFTILICSSVKRGSTFYPRFGFTQTSPWKEPASTEQSFYRCARQMEENLTPIYRRLCELQILLENERLDRNAIEENIESIVISYRNASKVFNDYHRALRSTDKDIGFVDPKYWLHYTQSPHSWARDGIHGSAGTQFPIYRILDILCRDIGKGWAWDSASGSFENESIPKLLKTFTAAVSRADLGGELTKRLGEVEAGRLLSKIVKVQVAFRASHASKARRYFAKDNPFVQPLNSFGVVDNTTYGTNDRKSLGEIFFPQLNERVDQSRKHVQTLCPLGKMNHKKPSASLEESQTVRLSTISLVAIGVICIALSLHSIAL